MVRKHFHDTIPPRDDKEAWKAYWKEQGQPWRTEPEVDRERQHQLIVYQTTIPDIEKGSYPFKGIPLSRADVEWLLSMQEEARGQHHGSTDGQQKHPGLDLRGADLSQINLSGLPLTHLRAGLSLQEGRRATVVQSQAAAANLMKADLSTAHLQGADLSWVLLDNAILLEAHLEGADLGKASLKQAILAGTHLEGADLTKAHLEGATLLEAHLEGAACLSCSGTSEASLPVEWHAFFWLLSFLVLSRCVSRLRLPARPYAGCLSLDDYMLRSRLLCAWEAWPQYCELKSRNSSASLGKGSGEAIEKVRMCESRNDETGLHVVTV